MGLLDLFASNARRENRRLGEENEQLRMELREARHQRTDLECDRDVWKNRAIGFSDLIVDGARDLREARRANVDLKALALRQAQIIEGLQEVNEKHYADMAELAGAFGAQPLKAVA